MWLFIVVHILASVHYLEPVTRFTAATERMRSIMTVLEPKRKGPVFALAQSDTSRCVAEADGCRGARGLAYRVVVCKGDMRHYYALAATSSKRMAMVFDKGSAEPALPALD